MRQEFLKNQILYYRELKNQQIEDLTLAYAKKQLTTEDYNNAINSRKGALDALELDFNSNLEEEIVNSLKINNTIKNQITYDYKDMFYLVCGSIDTLMLLLTVSDNPLSCCPVNKEIISEEISEEKKRQNSHIENLIFL